jgi:hypothetical protein
MSVLRHLILATLALGFAGALATPSEAGGRYDRGCANCDLPDGAFQDRRVVQHDPRYVRGRTQIVDTTRVIPRHRYVDDNTMVVHVRPVVRRNVVINRQNVVYRDVVIHRQNVVHRTVQPYQDVVEYRTVPGVVSYAGVEHRYVRGTECDCGAPVAYGPPVAYGYDNGYDGYENGYRTVYSVRNR